MVPPPCTGDAAPHLAAVSAFFEAGHFLELPVPIIGPHLIFLLKKHLQDLLCEKEKVETPKHHCRLGDIIIFQRVETKSLRVQENTVSLRK
jgi:hypothetical protein